MHIVEPDHSIPSHILTSRYMTATGASGFIWTAPDVPSRSPTAIHFSIDGRQGILEARHIVEVLHIPYEPVDLADFQEWSPVSQRDMVHILSRGTFVDSFLLHKELPPGMLLIDVLLRSNLFPFQCLVQKRGAILDILFRISKGFYLGPHHLIMASLIHFEEKDELPTESGPPAPTAPMPEATYTAPPTTPTIPPNAPSTSEASIPISATEFRAMIQQHLGLLPPPQPDIPRPSKPIAPIEETIPAEKTTRVDVPIQPTYEATTKPSSSHDPTTT
ncbi:hypothetical protein CK203_109503 [Vitis vinifera]|uniref:Uncharacterized protein n=1 Tax=Vitis vinifera TaxID=29760 RepID=A0A438CHH8_VITVI|nr:hypothetical protein CK203_109503 [Vitis vinifera]